MDARFRFGCDSRTELALPWLVRGNNARYDPQDQRHCAIHADVGKLLAWTKLRWPRKKNAKRWPEQLK